MDLTSIKFIKNLLKKHKTYAQKRFGQNFLISKSVLQKIIKAAELSKKDIVIEIGPGIGTLTYELAKRVKKVIAIEKDKKMIEILKETLQNFQNVEIVQGDILKIDTRYKILDTRYKIVANLPYYIVSPVIRKFLEFKNPPKEMILMVQKEVGQRICAKPSEMSILAVSVQFYAKPKIISYVSKKSFWPQPKVDSAIIKLKVKSLKSKVKSQKLKVNTDLFFKIVKAGFSQPRKMLINNLSRLPESAAQAAGRQAKKLKIKKPFVRTREEIKKWLLENSINPSQRAETLSVEDWINLTKSYRIKT